MVELSESFYKICPNIWFEGILCSLGCRSDRRAFVIRAKCSELEFPSGYTFAQMKKLLFVWTIQYPLDFRYERVDITCLKLHLVKKGCYKFFP